MSTTYEKATFAAGCFWGVEAQFRKLIGKGVIETRVGYTGGHTSHPTYREVCAHTTGHAEAVEVTYDPEKISYEDLVRLFFEIHNPTEHNRQGPDIGSQYRSEIFFHNEKQHQAAQMIKKSLENSKHYDYPIVTKITKACDFYPAEDDHQRYFEKHKGGHCNI